MSVNNNCIDKLTLTYDGNQLKKVSDGAAALTYEGAMDFRDGADETTPWLSPYSYCGGDPVNYLDKDGLVRLDAQTRNKYPLCRISYDT